MRINLSNLQTASKSCARILAAGLAACFALSCHAEPLQLERVKYNNPGLIVDLGVGLWAWPLPMDFNGDGRLDLVVSCPDKPYNGVYVFENAGPNPKFPIFKPARRISKAIQNVQVSYVDGKPRVLSPDRFGKTVTAPAAGKYPSQQSPGEHVALPRL